MKTLRYIWLVFFFACEEVVIIDLPESQSLIVVEGFISDSVRNQQIRISRSNSFSDKVSIVPIENATVVVQNRFGVRYSYNYDSLGFYSAEEPYSGSPGQEYRVLVTIDTLEIRSDWDRMPEKVEISNLQIDSFLENDPNGSGQQVTVFFPKVLVLDPVDRTNFYRWLFLRNGVLYSEPEPITIQNDRLFDGNIVPNNFRNFQYELGDECTVQLVSISQQTHSYLSLLRSQITTLGTSGGTTPAVVTGNLSSPTNPSTQILGYFGAVSVSQETTRVE